MNETEKNKAVRTIQSRKFIVSMCTIAMAICLYFVGAIDIELMLKIVGPASLGYVGSLGLEDMAKNLLPMLKKLLEEKS